MDQSPPIKVSPPQSNTESRWPKVLGVIAIIFGILGILGGAYQPINVFVTKMQLPPEGGLPEGFLAEWTNLTYINGALQLIAGIILLVGGLKLLKRKPVASMTLQVWSLLKIVVGLLTSFIAMKYGAEISGLILKTSMAGAGAGGPEEEMIGKFMEVGAKVGLIFGFIWVLILPVFFLIWFNKAKIKAEIAEWRAA